MPGPGAAHEHVYHMNPAKEFVDHSDEHVDSAFEEFKSVHGKAYGSAKEHTARRDIFRQNMRLIHSHNRKHTTYEMNSNHMADWTAKEMKMMRGRL